MIKLKICGMKYSDNILEVSQLLPDYLGFIFYEKSARFFEGEIPILPNTIQKVGVFVNASLQYIINKIKEYNLNLIQLHGNESPEFCKSLQTENLQIIKVFSVDETFDFERLIAFEKVVDYFLFDTKGKLHGGNGFTFDWKILKNYKSQKQLILSGGIGLNEIEKLKNLQIPIFAIDVNSKFEIEAGLKDVLKLKKLNQQLTKYNNNEL